MTKKGQKLKFGPMRTQYQGKIFSIKERGVIFPDGTKTTMEFCKRPASVSILAFNEKNELLIIMLRTAPRLHMQLAGCIAVAQLGHTGKAAVNTGLGTFTSQVLL